MGSIKLYGSVFRIFRPILMHFDEFIYMGNIQWHLEDDNLGFWSFMWDFTEQRRMSTFQITSSQPSICFRNTSQALRPSPKLLVPTCLQPTYNASIRQQRMPVLKAQQCRVLSKYHQSAPVCLLGGKGKSESGDEVRGLCWAMGTQRV